MTKQFIRPEKKDCTHLDNPYGGECDCCYQFNQCHDLFTEGLPSRDDIRQKLIDVLYEKVGSKASYSKWVVFDQADAIYKLIGGTDE